jgi:hypothetical protein
MGLSFFGLMPIAGLGVTSLADAIGMRTALEISSIAYGTAALLILNRIGLKLNTAPAASDVASEAEPVVAEMS